MPLLNPIGQKDQENNYRTFNFQEKYVFCILQQIEAHWVTNVLIQIQTKADGNDNDDERIQNDLNHPFPSKIEITVFDTALPNNQLKHGNQHA
ncbi:hypothetical protein MJO29_016889 [Puccinia striiformis f. sp. tritici]|nr:hypothetical protein MJO29_016889 [Puccinia striiformis f. sp. tritici]